jgi:hypothetical protein
MIKRMIGTVKDFSGFIVVAHSSGMPLKNFNSWNKFYKWLDVNGYNMSGNVVFKWEK